MLTRIKQLYQQWKDRRFLKKHHCQTWEQYHRQYDPDINWRATRVRDFYAQYPYVHCFENRNHQIYHWDLAYDGSREIVEWCEQHCKDKFRFDGLRAMKAPSTANQWEMNDLGGGDYYFVGFKNAKDYSWFLLRWS